MISQTDKYLRGMQAVDNFFAMLYQALRETLPTAQISENGAYFWRGYQINTYEDLAPNQYYCQIYPGNPNTGGLTLTVTPLYNQVMSATSGESLTSSTPNR